MPLIFVFCLGSARADKYEDEAKRLDELLKKPWESVSFGYILAQYDASPLGRGFLIQRLPDKRYLLSWYRESWAAGGKAFIALRYLERKEAETFVAQASEAFAKASKERSVDEKFQELPQSERLEKITKDLVPRPRDEVIIWVVVAPGGRHLDREFKKGFDSEKQTFSEYAKFLHDLNPTEMNGN